MKTVKIILSAAIVALVVNSCSSDRDDEVKTEPAKLELKPLKKEAINNQGSEASKTGDTVTIGPRKTDTMPGGGLDPTDPDPNDPNEGGDPKGLPPRN